MPRLTGVPSIITAARTICRLVDRFGTGTLAGSTTPEFAAAVIALVAACKAFEALDPTPGEIDPVDPA